MTKLHEITILVAIIYLRNPTYTQLEQPLIKAGK